MKPNQAAKSFRPAELAEIPDGSYRDLSFTLNPDLDRYLKMDKGFVGIEGVGKLREIYRSLSKEDLPRFLDAAGWAATEEALVSANRRPEERLALLKSSELCWNRALLNQRILNNVGPRYLAEYSAPYRIALNIAVMPLLRGMVQGDVTSTLRKQAYQNCLELAVANDHQLGEYKQSDRLRYADHLGFSHEMNALLAFNRQQSASWFMIPTMARADSGHYNREQTHDLLVVHHKWGTLKSVLPVEVKDRGRAKDRKRYQALMFFGNADLMGQQLSGRELLEALKADFTHTATAEQIEAANLVTGNLVDKVRAYYAGEVLSTFATQSVTMFHDRAHIDAKDQAFFQQNPTLPATA